jgi:hypothetical protein
MKINWFQKVREFLFPRKHVFVVKSSDSTEDVSEAIAVITNTIQNVDVDVFNDCNELFLTLNGNKERYHCGVVNVNDKKNSGNILTAMIGSINPEIKMFIYSDKNTLRNELVMA